MRAARSEAIALWRTDRLRRDTGDVMTSPLIPCAGDIDRELGRISASASFRAAPRLTAFLRFVVEMAAAGHGGRIKSYTVAVEAFGRDEGFDPQRNPIVRVEASRLRRALARFHAGEGHGDTVVIELPRGRYVPNFRERRASDAGELGTLVAGLERLIEIHRLQAEAIAAEVAAARQMLEGRWPGVPSTAGPARDPPRSETRPRSRCRHCSDRRL